MEGQGGKQGPTDGTAVHAVGLDGTQLVSPASRRTTPGAEVVDALQGRQAKPTLCPGDSRRLDSGGQLGQSAEP